MLSPAYNAVFTFDPAAGKVKIENFGGFAANAEYGFVADMIERRFRRRRHHYPLRRSRR